MGRAFSNTPPGTAPVASIDNTELATMAANTIKANATSATAAPQDVAVAANKFLARSSAGDIAAKDITDFALTLLDDANNTAAQATLGLGTAALLNAADAAVRTGYTHDLVAAQGSATTKTRKYDVRESYTQTTNGSNTTLDTYAFADGDVAITKARIFGRKDATDSAAYTITAAWKCEAGAVALIGSLVADLTAETAGAAAWGVTYDVSTNSARIRVTGAAGTNIDWWALWEITVWHP